MCRSEKGRPRVHLHAHGGGAGGGHVGVRPHRSRSLHSGEFERRGWEAAGFFLFFFLSQNKHVNAMSPAAPSSQVSLQSLCARGSSTPSARCSSLQVSLNLLKKPNLINQISLVDEKPKRLPSNLIYSFSIH